MSSLLLDSKTAFVDRVQRTIVRMQSEGTADPDVDPRYAAHADRSVHLFDGRVVEETRPGQAHA